MRFYQFVFLLIFFCCTAFTLRAQTEPMLNGTLKPHLLGDFDSEDIAYVSLPSTPPLAGIVLVPDAYGLDVFTEKKADYLASLGYLVVAVDLYTGQTCNEQSQADNMAANIDAASSIKTITAGIRLLRESPQYRTPHVLGIGWGIGAKYLVQTAKTKANLEGVALFCPPLDPPAEKMTKSRVSYCALYASKDPSAPHDSVLAYQKAMRDAGNDFSAWFIEGGRSWSNPASPTYNPGEDAEAWKVLLPFLQRIAAGPERPVNKPSILDKMDSLFK